MLRSGEILKTLTLQAPRAFGEALHVGAAFFGPALMMVLAAGLSRPHDSLKTSGYNAAARSMAPVSR